MNAPRPTTPTVLGAPLGPAGPESAASSASRELDRYVELELAGGDADAAVPGLRAHLEGCSACAEDRDALRALLLADAGRTRGAAPADGGVIASRRGGGCDRRGRGVAAPPRRGAPVRTRVLACAV